MQNSEIEYTRENAKVEFEKNNFTMAKTIFTTLWEHSKKDDAYLLFEYGKVLRKLNESNIFIQICEELKFNQSIISNKYIVSLLCWCFYDRYVKTYSVEDTNGFAEFIKRAEYVQSNCKQMEADEHFKTPYVLTILKVVKIYNDKSSKNYKEIIRWLLYLDPERLSEKDYNFIDETGKQREKASHKEFYFQHISKAYEKIQKYQECILICETALKNIKKFHYKNALWFKARLHFCKCMMQENIENAISEYKALAEKEKYWFMFHKLSLIYWRYNKIPEALLSASKAYTQRFEHEKMVNLLQDTALLWQAVRNEANAKLFFQASAYYRKLYGWPFTEELKYAVNNFTIDVEQKPDIKKMQSISNNYIEVIEGKTKRFEGIVEKILSHGGSGFIRASKSHEDVYFNMKSVLNRKVLKVGDLVEYELLEKDDGKIQAINIKQRNR